MLNRLLDRQIRRYLKNTPPNAELTALFEAISAAYNHHDEDRQLIERSLEISSAELTEANRSLREASQVIQQKNQDLISSLEYAKLIQDSILAREGAVSDVFPESFVFNRPRDIVSGDFFWVHSSGNCRYLATADCTGHGVSGAFLSVLSYGFLNRAVREQGLTDPPAILSYLNEEISHTLSARQEDPVAKNALDIGLVRIDKQRRILDFSGLSQKMLISQNGSFLELQGEKGHIGTSLDTGKNPITSQRVELEPGARMYMFSDGFQDQFGGLQGRRFGFGKLKSLLASVQEMRLRDQKTAIQAAFENWKNGLDQIDDTLLIGFEAG